MKYKVTKYSKCVTLQLYQYIVLTILLRLFMGLVPEILLKAVLPLHIPSQLCVFCIMLEHMVGIFTP